MATAVAKQKTPKTPAIETVNIGAAAVDIGSREHMAAVNPDATDDDGSCSYFALTVETVSASCTGEDI